MSIRWLGRETVLAPYLTLCMSESEYLAAVKHCNVKDPSPWLNANHKACVHTWELDGKITCVVCLNPAARTADPIEVACDLVHESVHVFQRLCDSIGEG